MRCPSCGFVTFDHLANCKKCGKELRSPPGGRRVPSPVPVAPSVAQASTLPGAPTGHPGAEAIPMGDEAPAAATKSRDAGETLSFDLPPAPSARAPMGASFAPAAVAAEDLGVRYAPAGLWIRSLALYVDGIIQTILVLAVAVPIVLSSGILGALTGPDAALDFLANLGPVLGAVSLVCVLIPLLYGVLFVGWRGQTPGKMLLRVKIIRADGGEVDYIKAFIRWIGFSIVGFLAFLAAFNKDRRALHDYLAGTRVVRL